MPRTIHVWVGDLLSRGGIQCYSRDCLVALRNIYPDWTLRVFSLNDKSLPDVDASIRCHYFGRLPPRFRGLIMGITGLFFALLERPVFVYSTHPHFLKALKHLKSFQVQVLSAIHGIEIWGPRVKETVITNLKHATGLLPVSHFTKNEFLTRLPYPSNRIRVVGNTYREHLFAPGPKPEMLLRKFNLASSDPVLLTVARMSSQERYKGHDLILETLPVLISKHPRIRYVIVGTGDDEKRLQVKVKQMNLSAHVTFAGMVPDEELADYYRLADLFVMPSRGEGFGIVFLEALACGTPCIAGNQDASSEAIDGGRLGILVSPYERDQLVDAIHSYLTGTDGKPWLHEPETLSEEVKRIYGKAAFEKNLKMALEHLFISGF